MDNQVQYEIEPSIYNRRWTILAVLCTSLLIVIVGNTSLNVALPTLSRSLDASNSQLQWMIDSYALVFAGLLFTAGSLGDRFGRKGALQAGLFVFLLGAALASSADTAAMVIASRAVMGVAAAFVMPSTLSILTNVFPAGERAKAISIWAGISGAGAAIGPIASGWLLEHFWWGSVFLVNVPIILVALVAGAIVIPKSKDPDKVPLDFPGAILSIIGLSALVYGIIEGPHNGWTSGQTLATFGIAVVALGLFGLRELTTDHPMLDLRLFRDRRFSVASGGMALTFFAMFGTFFLVAQYFQEVLDYSPLQSGLLQLPMAFVIMSVAPQAPRLVERFGAARVVPAGLGSTALGLAIFSQMQTDSPLTFIYLAIVPLAAGMALTMTPLTTLIMSSVPLNRAGVGSAMNDTTRELGGALGVAVLGSVVTSRYTAGLGTATNFLPDGPRAIAESGISGAMVVAEKLPKAAGDALTTAARNAFVDGMGTAALLGAVVVLSAAVAAYFLLPHNVSGQANDFDDIPHDDEGSENKARAAAPVLQDLANQSPIVTGSRRRLVGSRQGGQPDSPSSP